MCLIMLDIRPNSMKIVGVTNTMVPISMVTSGRGIGKANIGAKEYRYK